MPQWTLRRRHTIRAASPSFPVPLTLRESPKGPSSPYEHVKSDQPTRHAEMNDRLCDCAGPDLRGAYARDNHSSAPGMAIEHPDRISEASQGKERTLIARSGENIAIGQSVDQPLPLSPERPLTPHEDMIPYQTYDSDRSARQVLEERFRKLHRIYSHMKWAWPRGLLQQQLVLPLSSTQADKFSIGSSPSSVGSELLSRCVEALTADALDRAGHVRSNAPPLDLVEVPTDQEAQAQITKWELLAQRWEREALLAAEDSDLTDPDSDSEVLEKKTGGQTSMKFKRRCADAGTSSQRAHSAKPISKPVSQTAWKPASKAGLKSVSNCTSRRLIRTGSTASTPLKKRRRTTLSCGPVNLNSASDKSKGKGKAKEASPAAVGTKNGSCNASFFPDDDDLSKLLDEDDSELSEVEALTPQEPLLQLPAGPSTSQTETESSPTPPSPQAPQEQPTQEHFEQEHFDQRNTIQELVGTQPSIGDHPIPRSTPEPLSELSRTNSSLELNKNSRPPLEIKNEGQELRTEHAQAPRPDFSEQMTFPFAMCSYQGTTY